jgi:hypothetical protein
LRCDTATTRENRFSDGVSVRRNDRVELAAGVLAHRSCFGGLSTQLGRAGTGGFSARFRQEYLLVCCRQ